MKKFGVTGAFVSLLIAAPVLPAHAALVTYQYDAPEMTFASYERWANTGWVDLTDLVSEERMPYGPTYDGERFEFTVDTAVLPLSLAGATLEIDDLTGPAYGSVEISNGGITKSLVGTDLADFYSKMWGGYYTNALVEFGDNGDIVNWFFALDFYYEEYVGTTDGATFEGWEDIYRNGEYYATDYWTYTSGPGTWMRTGSIAPAPAPIPLPAGLPLLASAVALIGLARLRARTAT